MSEFKGKGLINRLLRIDLSEIKARSDVTPEIPLVWDIIIVPAWREIKFCFDHGLDWAVVLLSSALLEYSVKDRAFNIEFHDKGWSGKDRERYFKDKAVEYTIKRCLDGKLITDNEADELKNICQKIRDQASHMNILKIGKDKVFPEMPMFQKDTGLMVIFQNVKGKDNPIAGKLAFWEEINHLAIEMVVKCHSLLLSIYKDVIQKQKDGKIGGAVIGKW